MSAAAPEGLPAAGPPPRAGLDVALDRGAGWLRGRQLPDGRFPFCLEANVLPDASLLIAMRLGGQDDDLLVERLAARLLEKQRPSGAWALFPDDGDGNLSSTIEAYFALLLAGRRRDEPELRRARAFIRGAGGLAESSSLTRVVLAIAGQLPWGQVPAMPVELALAAPTAPLSLTDFVSFTRVHLPPLMVLAALRYSVPTPAGCELGDLVVVGRGRGKAVAAGALRHRAVASPRLLDGYLRALSAQRLLARSALRRRSLERCERFLLERQEADGTLGSYVLSTIFMIFAYRALGYDAGHPRVQAAWAGLRGLVWDQEGLFHVQPCTSTVWDTALSAQALAEAGAPRDDEALARAARYLLARESTAPGDDGPCARRPGGWGFQDVNQHYPDVDDTTAALGAIRHARVEDPQARDHAFERGLAWVLAMQNPDGGWSAFDRGCRKSWLERIPFNDMRRAMTDPSSADMTGRTLEFLAGLGHRVGEPRVDRAVRWLLRDQRADGSWFGRWGIAYLYGTWAALWGLAAVGVPAEAEPVRRAVAWLERAQNGDGGFGESARSDMAGAYVALGRSTPSQTAWAALALTASAPGAAPTPSLARALAHLVETQRPDGSWREDYPTGAGFAGKIYLQYHSYRQVWPILALARYRARFG